MTLSAPFGEVARRERAVRGGKGPLRPGCAEPLPPAGEETVGAVWDDWNYVRRDGRYVGFRKDKERWKVNRRRRGGTSMQPESNSSPRHVVAVERNGITHLTTYTLVDGVIHIRNPMGAAVGPANGDPEGEALRLFDRLVQTYEGSLRRSETASPDLAR
jgi:hypothetical protein